MKTLILAAVVIFLIWELRKFIWMIIKITLVILVLFLLFKCTNLKAQTTEGWEGYSIAPSTAQKYGYLPDETFKAIRNDTTKSNPDVAKSWEDLKKAVSECKKAFYEVVPPDTLQKAINNGFENLGNGVAYIVINGKKYFKITQKAYKELSYLNLDGLKNHDIYYYIFSKKSMFPFILVA